MLRLGGRLKSVIVLLGCGLVRFSLVSSSPWILPDTWNNLVQEVDLECFWEFYLFQQFIANMQELRMSFSRFLPQKTSVWSGAGRQVGRSFHCMVNAMAEERLKMLWQQAWTLSSSWKDNGQAELLRSVVEERERYSRPGKKGKKTHDEFGESQVIQCCKDIKFEAGNDISLQMEICIWRALYKILNSWYSSPSQKIHMSLIHQLNTLNIYHHSSEPWKTSFLYMIQMQD